MNKGSADTQYEPDGVDDFSDDANIFTVKSYTTWPSMYNHYYLIVHKVYILVELKLPLRESHLIDCIIDIICTYLKAYRYGLHENVHYLSSILGYSRNECSFLHSRR